MGRLLRPGEPAPWFHASALNGNPRYAFDTAAGRWIVMLFLGSGGVPAAAPALDLVACNRALFDDDRACFFGVTVDRADAEQGRVAQSLPGIRWFLDFDWDVSQRFGARVEEGGAQGYQPHWLLLDPAMRVHSFARLADGAQIMAELQAQLDGPQMSMPAPVLVVPRIFPPALCRRLIDLYEENGGRRSGFMHEENGVTVEAVDASRKSRADYTLQDADLVGALKERLTRVLQPMLLRAFQFEATRIERFIVSCYDAESGGHFRQHRDNTTKGTAHRKFACTINLNAEDYDGGELCFPEFGQGTYRAPTGGAVVFSCSLLHEARPVTRGKRYAFLPFFYDDAGARLREANMEFVAEGFQGYKAQA